jgi:uncharacterized protein YndB with AHSA1/START domain
MTNPITIQNIISAPVSTTWECYTSPEHIKNWNFASPDWCCPSASNDLKVGGTFSFQMEAKDGLMGFDFGGYYTALENQKLINYTMGKAEVESAELARKVEITFEKVSEDLTKITINFEPETENPVEMQQAGWQSILDNFKKYTQQIYQDQMTMMSVNATISSTLINPLV